MAFNPTRDGMTMYTIGVMREQVRRSRRQAEAARRTAEAVVSRTQASAQERRILRDVMVAWINDVEARLKQPSLDSLDNYTRPEERRERRERVRNGRLYVGES